MFAFTVNLMNCHLSRLVEVQINVSSEETKSHLLNLSVHCYLEFAFKAFC